MSVYNSSNIELVKQQVGVRGARCLQGILVLPRTRSFPEKAAKKKR